MIKHFLLRRPCVFYGDLVSFSHLIRPLEYRRFEFAVILLNARPGSLRNMLWYLTWPTKADRCER